MCIMNGQIVYAHVQALVNKFTYMVKQLTGCANTSIH